MVATRTICIASMAPFLGGAEVAAERLAIGLRDAGYDVFLVLGKCSGLYERLEKAGLRCVYVPMYFTDKWHMIRYWRARNRLRSLLRQQRPDVIHSNDLPTHQIVADAARPLGIPRICHHRFPYDGSCIDWLNKFGAERHLFVSNSFMKEMIARSPTLAASSRGVVHDGIPIPPLPGSEERRQRRIRLGLPLDKHIVLLAGQVVEIKGVADLLHAWMMLGEDVRQKAELVVVGDDLQSAGTYRLEMEELARGLGCPARFVGFQANMADWQMTADLAVVPSHVEPFGLVVLEALAFEVPVVACAVGGICETMVHGETGLLVPPRSPQQLAEAIDQLLRNGEMRHRMGAAGRRRCEERFSLKAHTQKILDEYSQVLHQRQEVLTR
jgi:glycosyltransferase involved in cell wall biosynthesis